LTTAREELIPKGQPGVYQRVSRVVCRAFLLGDDPCSGKNYDHRRGWVRQRLMHLVRCFAIVVAGYAVMSNHSHILVRVRPEVAKPWSDWEGGVQMVAAETQADRGLEREGRSGSLDQRDPR